jgi:peptidoglycan/xylan/chitin deacetylase (PgdA/CDA1 family)
MRLEEVARGLREGDLPDGAVCVTFDDGYRDNLYVALPLLERYGVPATCFLTTGRFGRDREFWWDELERILLQPGALPETLRLQVDGTWIDRKLGTSAKYTKEDQRRDREWTLVDPAAPTPRHAVFRTLYGRLQELADEERTRVLDALQEWAGATPAVRPSHRMLEADEVATLAAAELVEIGAHTVNHPALPCTATDEQREEIARSKETLERWSGAPVKSFAYPYGRYSDDSVAAVREAGFEYACACLGRAVRRDSGRFLLPRVDAPNQDGAALAGLLAR